MQAMQSRIALDIALKKDSFERSSGQLVVRRHSRTLSVGRPKKCESKFTAVWVADRIGLAHDVRNLLGALNLYSEILALPGVLSEGCKDYADEIRLLSERSSAMIERLLDHAQRDQDERLTVTVLPDVVTRCSGMLARIAERRIDIECDAGAFVPVNISAEAVERIVTNLVKNAGKATSAEKAISVSVRSRVVCGARRVAITVSDEGSGMSASMVRKLQRSGSMSRSGGIGFRVVRELVAISGGCLSVASTLGVGTTISVEWDAVAGEDDSLDLKASVIAERGAAVRRAEAGWRAH
jgi:signal transduction histidine kinase